MSPRDFLTFEHCLLWAVARWPAESEAMLGPAAASPESPPAPEPAGSWARLAFPAHRGDAREFDRAALAMRCLWSMATLGSVEGVEMAGLAPWMPSLDRALAKGGFEPLCYFALFNDLGKLASVERALADAGWDVPIDHDDALALAIAKIPSAACPGLAGLGSPWPALWLEGMSAGFNPGMAMQMEAPRAGWAKWAGVSEEAKEVHALHCFVDALGSSGAKTPRSTAPALAGAAACEAFHGACFGSGPEEFERALAARLGLSGQPRWRLAIAALSRAGGPAQAARALEAADALGPRERDGLSWALAEDSRAWLPYAAALCGAPSGPGIAALGEACASLRERAGAGEAVVAHLGGLASLAWSGRALAGGWAPRPGGWTWE